VTAVEYSKLSRPQKIAALLIVAGPEAAAEVLRPFPDAEVEEICQLMGGFEVISQEFRDHLIEEFEPLIIGGLKSIEGGYEFAKKALDLSRGEFKTGAMLSRIGASVTLSSARLLERISEMEGRDVFLLLKREQPQTIAFVLSYIDKTKAEDLAKQLDEAVMGNAVYLPVQFDKTFYYRNPRLTNIYLNGGVGNYYDYVNIGTSDGA